MAIDDKEYIARYLETTQRYASAARAIRPVRVYPDPVYPLQVVMVELPVEIPLRVDAVAWFTSRLMHREGAVRDDRQGHMAMVRLAHTDIRRKVVDILFLGEECISVYQVWMCFVYRGRNLIQAANQGKSNTTIIRYDRGLIWGDHPNLRKLHGI